MSYPVDSIERRKVGWRAWRGMSRLAILLCGWYEGANWFVLVVWGWKRLSVRGDEEGTNFMVAGRVLRVHSDS
jgi:hypothetical protein